MADMRDSRDEREEHDDAEIERKNKALQKALIGFALLALFFMFVVFKEYFIQFIVIGGSGELEKDKAAYGQFGDFFGGTLNPLFAFMSFIAVLFTVSLQATELQQNRKELRESRKIAEQQKKHFEDEAKKSEILQAIKQFEKEYGMLGEQLTTPGLRKTTINDVIDEHIRIIKSGMPLPQYDPEYTGRRVPRLLAEKAELLYEIDKLIGDYVSISQYKSNPPIKRYYRSKYHHEAAVFMQLNSIGIFRYTNLI